MISLLISNAGLIHTGYQIATDTVSNEKMLVGHIHKNDLAGDPVFGKWYYENYETYSIPDAGAVQVLRNHKDDIYLLIFGATWCEDTHFILPRLFKIQEASGFSEDRTALFALNRSKEMGNPIPQAFGISHTPTIVVMKDGREIGRVVEYGKTGNWEQELADIIKNQ